jgi:RNA polymerase sigma factor (sigma-70 family)
LQDDKASEQKLIQANLRLVVKIAKQYSSAGLNLQDLVQEGNLGLINAAGKFDYKKEVRFSTYASWWIKQSIIRALANKKRMIRLPHRKEDTLRRINKFIANYEHMNGQYPSMDDHRHKSGNGPGRRDQPAGNRQSSDFSGQRDRRRNRYNDGPGRRPHLRGGPTR